MRNEGIEGAPGKPPETALGQAPGARLDERYLDSRAQRYTEKTTFGGVRLSTRVSLFFFLGMLAAAAFTVLYLHVDRRVTAAVDEWKEAQRVAESLAAVDRAVNEIRIQDRRFAAEPSFGAAQALQRALNAVGVAVERLGAVPGDAGVTDAVVTVRDGFSQYGAQFTAYANTVAEVGYTEDTGLLGDRKAAAQDVRAKLKVIGLESAANDFDGIHAAGPDAVNDAAYVALSRRIAEAGAADSSVAEAGNAAADALAKHRSVSADIAQRQPLLDERPPGASDIIDYIGPSLRALSEFSAQLGSDAPIAFETERMFARQVIAGGSALILALLVVIGIVLMRSITGPVQRVAYAATRLAEGDRSASIPARGNTDAIGTVARALDAWLDNLTEIDHLRAELDDARLRLVAEAELRAVAQQAPAVESIGETSEPAAETENAASTLDSANVPPPLPTLDDTEPPPMALKRLPPSPDREDETPRAGSSPIGSASQELTKFSEFVNAATRDVERTEGLMRQLTDTARQIADLEQCVETIRDEAHLLVFRAPGGGFGGAPGNAMDDDTLVYLSGEGKREDDGAKRFDTIRDAVDRAERLVVQVRRSLDGVTAVAQEIASTASAEALEATNKLLSQSEYLQNMLDDLVHKMNPAAGLEGGDSDGGKPATPRRERDY